jgi:hypothetical protein
MARRHARRSGGRDARASGRPTNSDEPAVTPFDAVLFGISRPMLFRDSAIRQSGGRPERGELSERSGTECFPIIGVAQGTGQRVDYRSRRMVDGRRYLRPLVGSARLPVLRIQVLDGAFDITHDL